MMICSKSLTSHTASIRLKYMGRPATFLEVNLGRLSPFVELIVKIDDIYRSNTTTRMNFRHLDLNLLRVLAAIYRTGSVTAAGQQLALSQPATSNALARLREFFGDELFVRSPRGLHPTRTAQRIAPAVIAHLQALEATVLSAEGFDPAESRVHWRMSLSDLGEILFMPPLAQALRSEAPHCQLSNVAVAAGQVAGALEARDIDIAVGILQAGH